MDGEKKKEKGEVSTKEKKLGLFFWIFLFLLSLSSFRNSIDLIDSSVQGIRGITREMMPCAYSRVIKISRFTKYRVRIRGIPRRFVGVARERCIPRSGVVMER